MKVQDKAHPKVGARNESSRQLADPGNLADTAKSLIESARETLLLIAQLQKTIGAPTRPQ